MAVIEHRPVLTEPLTNRVGHHSTSDDSTKYCPADEIERWRLARDPASRFRKWIEGNSWWNGNSESELRSNMRQNLLRALQVAEKVDKRPLADTFTDIYHVPPFNLREQEHSLKETKRKHPQDYSTIIRV